MKIYTIKNCLKYLNIKLFNVRMAVICCFITLHFQSQPLMNLRIFATVHSLINDTKFDLTAAELTCPCNSLRTSNSFTRCDTGVVIDSEAHLSCTCKTSFLFAPLAFVFTLAVPLFRFALQQNRWYD